MSLGGKRKIAICFSGQLRTWRKCIDTWHHILDYHGDRAKVDVFCHMWDFNSIPNSVPNVEKPSVKIPQSEIDELVSILKPKKLIIQSEKECKPFTETQALTHPPFISQFYGILQAARLKKEYELENDMMYDAVVRARYDAYYLHNLTEDYDKVMPNTMHGFHLGWNSLDFIGRMGDIFWISDSETYDIIADYYLNLQYIQKSRIPAHFTPEFVFFHYIKKNSITIQPNHWDIKLMRQSPELSYTKKEGGFEVW